MPENDLKSCIHQWEHRKKLEKINLMIQKIGQKKDNEEETGSCGDTMQFFFKIKGNIIEKANFITDGCGASVVTASQTTLLIEGKSLEYAEKLMPIDIDRALQGLPEDHKHCAELAVKTVRRAISKYRNNSI